jgi:hypothetical protein
MASFVGRVVGAARLDIATYEEVEADATATPQAMGVVLLAALSSGIGALTSGGTGMVGSLVSALIGWAAWATVIWFIGTKILPEPQTRSDIGELLRTMGFAASPGLLLVLRLVPLIGGLIALVIWLWQLTAMVVAVRQALDYKSSGRAVLVCFIGWVFYLMVMLGIGLLFGIVGFDLG